MLSFGVNLPLKYRERRGMPMMIGDKEVDVTAANASGIHNTILVRSGHKIDQSHSNASFFLDSIQQAKQIITA